MESVHPAYGMSHCLKEAWLTSIKVPTKIPLGVHTVGQATPLHSTPPYSTLLENYKFDEWIRVT